MGAFDDLIPGYFQPDLAQGRSRFADELANPNIRLAFNQRVANEVGGQSEDEQQAFIESVMNRANARKQRLSDVVNDRSYFPSQSFRNAGDVDYSPFIQKAIQGSNVSRRATGNESGNVRSGGAPVTMAGEGGERFVVENKDTAFPFQDLIPGKQTAGAFDDLIPKKAAAPAAAPTPDTPTYAPQVVTPDQAAPETATGVLQDIYQHGGERLGRVGSQVLDYFDLQKQAQAPEQRSAGAKALEAAGQTVKGFVPSGTPGDPLWKQVLQVLGGAGELATPAAGGVKELIQTPDKLRQDIENIKAQDASQEPPYPEQLGPIYSAEKTPPFSQERFNVGANIVAQMLMAKGLAHGLEAPRTPDPTITPGRTMADIETAARAEPAGPQPEVKPGTIAEDVSRALKPEPVTTGDVTRAILDKRNDLVAEAQQLQQQADISRAATGQVHPAVEQRIAEINQELNQPETTPGIADMIRQQQAPTLAEKITQAQEPAAAPEAAAAPPEQATTPAAPQPIAAELPAEAAKPPSVPPEYGGPAPEIGVAARYREEQQPGSVEPGSIRDHEYWRGQGRDFINGGGDPRMPVRAAQAGHVSPRNVGIVSAEYERLAEATESAARAVQDNPGNLQAQAALDAATKDQAAWSREMQPVFTRAGETLGATQARMPVDETTFAGLYDKALELNGGKDLPKPQQAELVRRSAKVEKAKGAERATYAKMDKAVPGRAPTDAEMAARVDDIVRRLTPCQ